MPSDISTRNEKKKKVFDKPSKLPVTRNQNTDSLEKPFNPKVEYRLPFPYQHFQILLSELDAADRRGHYSKKTQLKHAVAGGLAGAITRFLTHPFDVVKVRFQMQAEPIAQSVTNSKYTSFSQAIRLMLCEEGVAAFFRGHLSGQLYNVTYNLFQFWAFEQFDMQLRNFKWFQENRSGRYFVAGSLSGSSAAAISMPFDVIRTRVAAKDPDKGANSIHKVAREIIQREGFVGFFRGTVISVVQTAPLVGFNFVFYKMLNHIVDKHIHSNNDTRPALIRLMNGGIAGVLAKIITYPMDLVKKRLQLRGFAHQRTAFGKNRFCKKSLECLYLIAQKEGITGFYKGLIPTLYKSGIQSALLFCSFDIIKFFL